MLAPFSTMSGARSPPMASSAMVTRSLKPVRSTQGRSRRLRRDRHHFAAVVMAAGRAHVMRPFELAAIRALDIAHRFEGMMRAAHVATRFGDLLFWDCHGTTLKEPHCGGKTVAKYPKTRILATSMAINDEDYRRINLFRPLPREARRPLCLRAAPRPA